MGRVTHLVFTDIETTALTGPNLREDSIIEVAAVRVRLHDRQIVDQFTSLIRPHGCQTKGHQWFPEWDLGEYHTACDRFQGVDWHGPQSLPHAEALHILNRDFFPGATFAGSNVPFDIEHYQRDFKALGWEWPKTDYHRFDLSSPALYLVMAGKIESVSLKNVAAWAGSGPQQHRALQDCYDGINAFWGMYDFFMGAMPPGIIRSQDIPHTVRDHQLGPDQIRDIVEIPAPGVGGWKIPGINHHKTLEEGPLSDTPRDTCGSGYTMADHRQKLCNC